MLFTSPVNFKQRGRFFWGNHGPGILRSLVAIQALLMTFQPLHWLKNVLYRPYARFERVRVPIWLSLVQ